MKEAVHQSIKCYHHIWFWRPCMTFERLRLFGLLQFILQFTIDSCHPWRYGWHMIHVRRRRQHRYNVKMFSSRSGQGLGLLVQDCVISCYLPYFFLFLLRDQGLYIVKKMNIYTHIWLPSDCLWITVATKQYCEWNTFTEIRSGAKCWQDIYHWGAGLSVIGRIWHWTKRLTMFFSNRK